MDDEVIMVRELDDLRTQHQRIENAITDLLEARYPDQLQMARLKREKLKLKDAIYRLEEQIYPDIIA
jgi:hypothetical protein